MLWMKDVVCGKINGRHMGRRANDTVDVQKATMIVIKKLDDVIGSGEISTYAHYRRQACPYKQTNTKEQV